MYKLKRLSVLAAAAFMVVSAPVLSQSSQADAMRAALSSPERSDADKARDAVRRPIEVISFVGIETGDSVLELVAAGGWYTQVLSAAVGQSGQVYAQNPAFFLGREGFVEAEAALHDRLGNVSAVHGEVAEAGIDGQMDAAITALNLHDMYNGGGEAAALPLIGSAFDALRSGGVFAVIDHRGIAGQPNADFHRMEQQTAEDLLEAAGFVVEATSEILANPADDHMRGAGDESLGRNSDRFLIRARKP